LPNADWCNRGRGRRRHRLPPSVCFCTTSGDHQCAASAVDASPPSTGGTTGTARPRGGGAACRGGGGAGAADGAGCVVAGCFRFVAGAVRAGLRAVGRGSCLKSSIRTIAGRLRPWGGVLPPAAPGGSRRRMPAPTGKSRGRWSAAS